MTGTLCLAKPPLIINLRRWQVPVPEYLLHLANIYPLLKSNVAVVARRLCAVYTHRFLTRPSGNTPSRTAPGSFSTCRINSRCLVAGSIARVLSF